MEPSLRIHYQGIESSEFIDQRIREKVQQLGRFGQPILKCRVSVEASHHHHHKGKVYTVGLDLALAGDHVVVRQNSSDHAHEDVYVALRDAFEVAERRLGDHARPASHAPRKA